MIIGFLGDVHGRAFHALVVLLRWQSISCRRFDLVIQVGDLGILPRPEEKSPPHDRFAQWDASVHDLFRLFRASGPAADMLRSIRAQFNGPIMFLQGNHDERTAALNERQGELLQPLPVDPFGLFSFVPDGFLLRRDGTTMAFIGGTEARTGDDGGLCEAALRSIPPGQVDILVTHEGPYGISTNTLGKVMGSRLISASLKEIKPRYHLFGHHHAMIGPVDVDGVQCIGLASLVADPRRPAKQVVRDGCLGIVDTEQDTFAFVTAPCLSGFGRGMDLQDLDRCLDGAMKR